MLTIQNVASSVRPVLFRTELATFPFATHGGTMFLIQYGARPYALTCAHVMGDFSAADLIVAHSQMPQEGSEEASRCKGFYSAADVGGLGVGSDVHDICVLDFHDGVSPATFGRTALVMNDENTGPSITGDQLVVFGILKDKSELDPETMVVGFALLDFKDCGPYEGDPVLRKAEGEWENHSISRLTGISGAPVFNLATGKLCGMVASGTVDNGRAIMRYIDIRHIQAFLISSVGGAGRIAYEASPR